MTTAVELKTQSVLTILSELSARRVTGTLRFEPEPGGELGIEFLFRKGRLLYATSNFPGERLGEFLVRQHVLSEEEASIALQSARKEGRLFQAHLAEEGLVGLDVLPDLLYQRTEELLDVILGSNSGRFIFRQELPPQQDENAPPWVDQELFGRLLMHRNVWPNVYKRLRDPHLTLRAHPGIKGSIAYHSLGPAERKLLSLMDGTHPVSQFLARRKNRIDLMIVIARFLESGLLQVVEATQPVAAEAAAETPVIADPASKFIVVDEGPEGPELLLLDQEEREAEARAAQGGSGAEPRAARALERGPATAPTAPAEPSAADMPMFEEAAELLQKLGDPLLDKAADLLQEAKAAAPTPDAEAPGGSVEESGWTLPDEDVLPRDESEEVVASDEAMRIDELEEELPFAESVPLEESDEALAEEALLQEALAGSEEAADEDEEPLSLEEELRARGQTPMAARSAAGVMLDEWDAVPAEAAPAEPAAVQPAMSAGPQEEPEPPPIDLNLVPTMAPGVKLADLSVTGLLMDDLFLISQIDGRSSMKELLQITQMPEMSARRVVHRLMERRYVTLQAKGGTATAPGRVKGEEPAKVAAKEARKDRRVEVVRPPSSTVRVEPAPARTPAPGPTAAAAKEPNRAAAAPDKETPGARSRDPAALYKRAIREYSDEQFAQSEDTMRYVLGQDRRNALYQARLAIILLDRPGKEDEAAAHAETAVEEDPLMGQCFEAMGLVKLRMGQLAEARRFLEQAVLLDKRQVPSSAAILGAIKSYKPKRNDPPDQLWKFVRPFIRLSP